jgi:death-on-curing protein
VSWVFLSVEDVQAIHDDLINIYGGLHGVRDAGLLESAVLRAENKAAYDPTAGIAGIAASLSFGLIKNHAFLDGNKRIGLAALVDLLGLNGHALSASTEEAQEMTLRAAASAITEEEWTAWVERSVAPVSE